MKKIIKIYTDGSHLKRTTGRIGCGGLMCDVSGGGLGKELDHFSVELTKEYLLSEFGTADVSNPTAEMVGALEALRRFNIPSDTDEIIMLQDYLGVMSWNTGTWKIKAPYIRKIKSDIDREIKRKGLSGKISWQWVKAHQGKSVLDPDAIRNNQADKLAKGEDYGN